MRGHHFNHLLEGAAGHEPGGAELVGKRVDADLFGPATDVTMELVEHRDPERTQLGSPVMGAIDSLVHHGVVLVLHAVHAVRHALLLVVGAPLRTLWED